MLSEHIIFSNTIKFLDRILARTINKALLTNNNALSRQRQNEQTRQHRTSYNKINYLENNFCINTQSPILNINLIHVKKN